jgi:hypothetical protein
MTRILVVDQGIGPDLTAIVLGARGPADRVFVLDHIGGEPQLSDTEIQKLFRELSARPKPITAAWPIHRDLLARNRDGSYRFRRGLWRRSKGWRRHVRRRKAAGLWP